ncbi:MAG: response regulator transcription factor [Bacteroidetes bacterium]|nr:response regulator transcription factor [Bacteroidota bacterium]
MTRVVIADSNDLILLGLQSILKSEVKVEIVGEARTNQQLIELLKEFPTDLLIIDYTAIGFEIDIIPQVINTFPSINVLAITPEQSAQTLVHALRSGVTSYIKKDCDTGEIIAAVNETSKGSKFFCGQILETIRKAEINVDDLDFKDFTCEPVVITDRECEIIVLIAEGYTNTQIADKLCLSNHTINTHRKNILSKLGVKNTAGIVMYAVKSNLVKPNKFLYSAS